MKSGVVKEFRNEYFFLSNFFPATFVWQGLEFSTGEHAFAYAKTFYALDKVEGFNRGIEIHQAPTPNEAKRLGAPRGGMKIDTKQWDEQRLWKMREIVHARFLQNTSEYDLAGMLVNTGVMLLVEGNDWGDTFWGRCKKDGKMVGFNTLGAILMEERGWWSRSDVGRPDGP